MNAQQMYWIPKGVSIRQQIAMSIPGPQPVNPVEHEHSLEAVLLKLAKELEEQQGPGSAYRVASQIVPDSNLFLTGEGIELEELVWILMESDQLQTAALRLISWGFQDKMLQQACREATFEERLVGLTTLD